MKIASEGIQKLADRLKKGDYVPPEQCARLLKYKPDDPRYSLAMLDLKSTLAQLMAERGYPVTLSADHDGIRVLTDEEASEYNHRSFVNNLGGMARAHQRMRAVDSAKLTTETHKKHALRMAIQQVRLDGALRVDSHAIAAQVKIAGALRAAGE